MALFSFPKASGTRERGLGDPDSNSESSVGGWSTGGAAGAGENVWTALRTAPGIHR